MAYQTMRSAALFSCSRLALLIAVIILTSCRSGREISADGPVNRVNILVRGGANWGGFVDNTEADGISGATHFGMDIGIHGEYNLKKHAVGLGLDYLTFAQDLKYNDTGNEYVGGTQYRYQVLNIPLTYNFNIVRSSRDLPVLTVKAGVAAGILLNYSYESEGFVPDPTFNSASFGLTFGLMITPLHFRKASLGVYWDLYRGSKIYEDPYHLSDDYGGLSHMQFGLIMKFRMD